MDGFPVKWNKFVGLFLLILAYFQLPPQAVQACGGGPPPILEEMLQASDVVVKGRVVDVDSAHQNGIMQVESYVMGEPDAAFLLVAQADSVFINIEGTDFGLDGCGTANTPLIQGQTVYIFLTILPDGSYEPVIGSTQSYGIQYPYRFATPDSTITLYQRNEAGIPEVREVTEAEFLSLLFKETGTNPRPPDPTKLDFPLLAPILVRTSNGSVYQIPVNSDEPERIAEAVQYMYNSGFRTIFVREDTVSFIHSGRLQELLLDCSENQCLTFSNDGIFGAYASAGTVQLGIGNNFQWQVPGRAFLFSSIGEVLAVWNLGSLTIYESYEGAFFKSIPIHYEASVEGRGAWSPDGRVVAFSDLDGLWLWDVFAPEAEPQLLIPTGTSIPYARYFSPAGNYVAIAEGSTLSNFDLRTGKRLPNGIFAPEDRVLAAFSSTGELPHVSFPMRLPMTGETMGSFGWVCGAQDFQWISASRYVSLDCGIWNVDRDDVPGVCFISANHDCLTSSGIVSLQIDYEPVGGRIVSAKDASTLEIYDVPPLALNRTLDLAGQLDGDVVDVLWMPALFYSQ